MNVIRGLSRVSRGNATPLGSRRKIIIRRVYGDIHYLLGDDADWWLYVNVGEASLSSFNLLS